MEGIMSMRTIVVGGGYFGVNYIRELGGNCVGVIETNALRAKYVKKSYNIPVWGKIPKGLDFEAVIIATPPGTHVDLALEFASQDYYVLLEKPLATSIEEAQKLWPHKHKIMAAMIYLYHPEIERLRQVVGEVPIHHIYTRRTNDGPIRGWQNALWDLAPHDISICNYILGQKPIGISAINDRHYSIVALDYVACQSVSYVSWLGSPKTRLVELVPAEGGERIIFDDMKSAMEISPMRRMLDDFLSKEWDERCSFDKGWEVLEVLEACR